MAGEAAGGAGLPGVPAGGGTGPHGGADSPKPGNGQEARGGGRSSGGVAGERVTLILLLVLLYIMFLIVLCVPGCSLVNIQCERCVMSSPDSSIQSERRAGCPACPRCSPAGREERPGGHEL